MKTIFGFLTAHRMGCLATVSGGRPRVRPWMFALAHEGKPYFCTSNRKEVFRQLQEVPFVEFTATSPEMVTVRLRGRIEFSSDIKLKSRVLDGSDLVRSIYQTPDNPAFELFFLAEGQATMSDFSGQPPQAFRF